MKIKLRYLIILSVLATIGVFVFQVIWLKSSYQLSKEKITADAKTVLDESIVEQRYSIKQE
jgi:hypothetical protein